MITLIEEHRGPLRQRCQRYRAPRLELSGSAASDDAFDPHTLNKPCKTCRSTCRSAWQDGGDRQAIPSGRACPRRRRRSYAKANCWTRAGGPLQCGASRPKQMSGAASSQVVETCRKGFGRSHPWRPVGRDECLPPRLAAPDL